MATWNTLPDNQAIEKTIATLKEHNITASLVQTEEEAKQAVLTLIPEGAEVMTMTSATIDQIGLTKEINESGKYDAIRPKLNSMDRQKDHLQMLKLGAAPEWVVGSVHAITEDGIIMIASKSGSQLPAYMYGSAHVFFVVGVQKIVKNMDEGMKRIEEYSVPLESERAMKAYGMDSEVAKMAIIKKDFSPDRIHVIFINENIGF